MLQAQELRETPGPAQAFVDSIGVNVHLTYVQTPYVTGYAAMRDLLVSLGVRHIRDGVVDTAWQPYYDHLMELARAGIHADLITNVAQSPALLRAYPQRVPGAIEAFEGPNEYDLSNDPSWPVKLRAFQTQLYATIHGAFGPAYSVIGPSLTTERAFVDVGSLDDVVDAGNVHDYFAGRNPGTRGWGETDRYGTYGSLAYNIALARVLGGSRPVVSTETGYGDDPLLPSSVSPAVKLRYTLRTLLEHWNAGVRRTYLYEFVDEGNDGFQSYGLVDVALRPKPVYLALRQLIRLLRDPGAPPPLLPLTYRIDADPIVHHTLLISRDGSYSLLLWAERPAIAAGAAPAPAIATTLSFPSSTGPVHAFVFNADGSVTSSAPRLAGRVLQISVSDDVVLLRIAPNERSRTRAEP